MSTYRILQAGAEGVFLLRFEGEIRLNLCQTIDKAIARIEESPDLVTVVVDLRKATVVDSTTLGLIARIGLFVKQSGKLRPMLISHNPDINRMIDTMGLDALFDLHEDIEVEVGDLHEIGPEDHSEAAVREQVLAAHRTLMSLNQGNRDTFRDLVESLE